jgi:hypothetical protein
VQERCGQQIWLVISCLLEALEDAQGMGLFGGGHPAKNGHEWGRKVGRERFVGYRGPWAAQGQSKLASTVEKTGEDVHAKKYSMYLNRSSRFVNFERF